MAKEWKTAERKEHLNALRLRLEGYRDLVLGNIIKIGEAPSHPWPDYSTGDREDPLFRNPRAKCFGESLAEIGVDECTTDELGNPIGIILGRNPSLPPIFVSSEIDSKYQPPWEYHYALDAEGITGSGLMDNALGAACLLSFADFARKEGLRFDSDIYLVGFTDTMEPGRYYESVDAFLDNFTPKIRGAVIVKGGQLGRLNYFCRAIIRAELLCEPASDSDVGNMIEVAHEIIDRLLSLRTPQKPKTELIIGKIAGGRKYGQPASEALIGFELHGDSDELVQEIFQQIENIAKGIEHELSAKVEIRVLMKRGASGLPYEHGLTQAALGVMESLDLKPDISASFSELYSFQKKGIPAVTVGMTEGSEYHTDETKALIRPLFTGLAQLVGIVEAIDEGACDE